MKEAPAGCRSEVSALDDANTEQAVRKAVKTWERGEHPNFSSSQQVEDAMKSLIADADHDCPNGCD